MQRGGDCYSIECFYFCYFIKADFKSVIELELLQ